MEHSNVLKQVAKQAGIADSYTNAWGKDESVSAETLTRLLAALGYDVNSEDALLTSAERIHQPPVLASVKVVKVDEPVHVEFHIGGKQHISDYHWVLETEQGDVINGRLDESVLVNCKLTGKVTFSLPALSIIGYHQLRITNQCQKCAHKMRLIVAPKACYKQPTIEKGIKSWGPSVQLYTLKTEHNWGIGDFGDLKQLVADIATRGGDFIGLNPIHALFPANPEGASPYSPSSRRWLNLLYIDVTAVPEFALCSTAQQQVGSNEFQQALHTVRATDWVDYSEVSRLKMSVLPLLFTEFQRRHLAINSQRAQDFFAFVAKGGNSLLHQATFDALHQQLHDKDSDVWGWQVFPEELRDINSNAVQTFVKQNQATIQRYMYFQWIADEQIADVQQFALAQGMSMGLYRDLAVGVADSGAEVWADDGILCQGASIGAPPDVLGPLGQNWGLPPLNPAQLKATGYDAFIQLLRANMQHCGALRIDHVLGLLRLWWIPKGENATAGAYMYYPVQDMLSILALESHRHQCAVIGEDLGTVPDEIVSLLSDAGIHSYKVFFFETAEDGGYFSPAHYQPQSMATLCTHDMPTLRGFWHCEDLKLGQSIGLYPDQSQLNGLFYDRSKAKQAILDSMSWHGKLAESVSRNAEYVSMDQALSNSLQLHLAAGSSSLLSLQLEDWLAMDKPVNVPGTVDEYPNWRRKLSVTLADMFSCPNVNYLSTELTAARAQASICADERG